MRTRAGKSTAWPSRLAGLNLICFAACTAASSRPWPSPLTTRFTWTEPSAWNTNSSTTSPSILRLRPSAVSWTSRQRRRAQPIYVSRFVGIAFTRKPVGVAKASGLHFIHRQIHGSRCRAPGVQVVDLHFVFRPLRSIDRRVQLRFKHRFLRQLRRLYLQLLYPWLKGLLLHENVRLLRVQLWLFDRFWQHCFDFDLWRLWWWGRHRD